MNRFLCVSLLCGFGVSSIPALSQPAKNTPKSESSANESKATIEGLVRDIACPIQNLEATATH